MPLTCVSEKPPLGVRCCSAQRKHIEREGAVCLVQTTAHIRKKPGGAGDSGIIGAPGATTHSFRESFVCGYCQEVGLHPLRQAAEKERMIDNHRSLCAEQYIFYRPCCTRLCLTCVHLTATSGRYLAACCAHASRRCRNTGLPN
jgi:hypothetical protein